MSINLATPTPPPASFTNLPFTLVVPSAPSVASPVVVISMDLACSLNAPFTLTNRSFLTANMALPSNRV